MNLCDSNIWLALALSQHSLHSTALAWLETIDGAGSLVFCRATQQSFLRLLTNPSVLGAYGTPALTNQQAWEAYEAFLGDDRVTWAEEPPGLEARWLALASRDTASPKLWMDAYLAGFALAGGYRMVTNDNGYSQFAGLNLVILKRPQDRAREL